MNSAALPRPKFVSYGVGRPPKYPDALVAAVRWDYEYGLLSIAQLVDRYRQVMNQNTVRGVAFGTTRSEVKAARNVRAWCNPKWRLQNDTN